MSFLYRRAHEKSPLSFGRRALVRGEDCLSAPDTEEAVSDHACCSQTADDRQDDFGCTARAALRTGPVIRPDQVDGDGGFAYVGRLFHGRKYSSRPKARSGAGRIPWLSCVAAEVAASRAKKYPHERVERASGFEVDVPVSFFVVALRDSKCKMPRQMGAVCSFGASCL